MAENHEVVLRRRPEGMPVAADFQMIERAAPPGAVGGTAGQIVRALGGRAIGIAGGPEKCALVIERYCFDACIDHRRDDWPEALKQAVGEGPTIHFENVGLAVYEKVFPLLRNYARVVLCGLAGHYHADGPPAAYPLGPIVAKRARVMGLVVYDYLGRLSEWVSIGSRWLREGKLVQRLSDCCVERGAGSALLLAVVRSQGCERDPLHHH